MRVAEGHGRDRFTTYCPLVPPESITIGNGEPIPAIGIGRVSINLKLGMIAL